MLAYIGMGALVVCIIGACIYAYDVICHSKHPRGATVALIAGILAGILLVPLIIISSCAPMQIEENVALYEELMIYKQTVEESDNEYLRWNYYNKVCDWNEYFDQMSENETNPNFWTSPYHPNLCPGLSRIDFVLNGDYIPE